MPQQNELVIVDSCVFLSKWLDDDVAYQIVDSDSFFESAKLCHYCIGMHGIVLNEVQNKYPFLVANLNQFAQELLNENKLCKIEEDIPESEVKKVKNDAKSRGYPISKIDAFLAILANRKKLRLVSFDQKLVDYCNDVGWDAEYPTNLINLESP